jgi:hypothetical protein
VAGLTVANASGELDVGITGKTNAGLILKGASDGYGFVRVTQGTSDVLEFGKSPSNGTFYINNSAGVGDAGAALKIAPTTGNATFAGSVAASSFSGPLVGAANCVISSTCGNYTTTGTSYQDITNLSCTITTHGRPVVLMMMPANTGDNGSFLYFDGTTGYLIFVRNSTYVCSSGFNNTTNVFGYSISTIDVPTAGTYTYKMQFHSSAPTGGIHIYNGYQLAVYEL